MKLLTPFTAIIAAAAAGQIYTTQPAEAYANSAEIYQSALEYQQQGLYSDQSHAFSGPSAGAGLHAYAGQYGDAGQSAYAGHGQSRPAGEKAARILSYESGSDGHGYQYAFETENGIKAQEIGQVTGHEKGTEAHGAYSYKGDDGQVYTVTYTAGEHGFNAQGAHLPTPPPIPEAIVKSLEQNAKDEAAGIYDDGKYPAQHESYQEQAIHGHAAGPLATQAFQYETSAIQHEFQPNQYQQGHQGLVQGHQFIDQGGHQSGQIGQVQGHQGLVQGHQLIDQGGHQTGHQIGLVQGHQGGQGYQLGSQQDHQPRGFQPSYIVASDGYHKH